MADKTLQLLLQVVRLWSNPPTKAVGPGLQVVLGRVNTQCFWSAIIWKLHFLFIYFLDSKFSDPFSWCIIVEV